MNQLMACSCGKVKIKDGFNRSDLLFTGRATEAKTIITIDTIGTTDKGELLTKEYKRVNYTFEVIELIKGDLTNNIVIITTTGGGADCGNIFYVGTEHLVYSYISEHKLGLGLHEQKVEPFFTTSLCTRTFELNDQTSKELKKLRKLAKKSQ